jgi:hypothetical protein
VLHSLRAVRIIPAAAVDRLDDKSTPTATQKLFEHRFETARTE